MEQIKNYINGEFQDASSGETLPCYEPATGSEYARIPSSSPKDVDLAVKAAEKAFPAWKAKTVQERSQYLKKIAQKITENLDRLAIAESKDNGKTIQAARTLDIPRSARNLDFFADAILEFTNESFRMPSGETNHVQRDPLGVVGCISPWNLPLYLLTWKIAPALAAGNCVVAKPSEVTPMTAYLLSQIVAECGLPAGVLNFVHGLGANVGSAMSRHPGIKAISFTGSTATGAQIAKETAGSFKKLSLEMGGKNPFIVFENVDLEIVTDWAVRAGFSNQGQICLCGSRMLIHKKIYDEFKSRLVEKVKALKVGDPSDEKTDQGALVSSDHFKKVSSLVERAKTEGGKILTGGRPVKLGGRCSNGYFYEPTVIEGLPMNSQTNQEEIFGPVVTIMPFSDEAEAIQLANQSSYGLAASIWTRDQIQADRVAKQIECGIVWVNTWMLRDLRTPFGGMKNSGVGREGGNYALQFFSETRNVCIGRLEPGGL